MSYQEFCEQNQQMWYRLAFSIVHDGQLAEQAALETCSRVAGHMKLFEKKSPMLRVWSGILVKDAAARMYQQQRGPGDPPFSKTTWNYLTFDGAVPPLETLEDQDAVVLCLHLQALDILLLCMGGISVRAAAELLGIPEDKAQRRFDESQQMLCDILTDEDAPKKLTIDSEQVVNTFKLTRRSVYNAMEDIGEPHDFSPDYIARRDAMDPDVQNDAAEYEQAALPVAPVAAPRPKPPVVNAPAAADGQKPRAMRSIPLPPVIKEPEPENGVQDAKSAPAPLFVAEPPAAVDGEQVESIFKISDDVSLDEPTPDSLPPVSAPEPEPGYAPEPQDEPEPEYAPEQSVPDALIDGYAPSEQTDGEAEQYIELDYDEPVSDIGISEPEDDGDAQEQSFDEAFEEPEQADDIDGDEPEQADDIDSDEPEDAPPVKHKLKRDGAKRRKLKATRALAVAALILAGVFLFWLLHKMNATRPPVEQSSSQAVDSASEAQIIEYPTLYDLFYELPSLPDGFRRVSHSKTAGESSAYFIDADGSSILFTQIAGDEPITGLNLEAGSYEPQKIRGYDGGMFEQDGITRIHWYHENFGYSIITDIDAQQALSLAQSASVQSAGYPTAQEIPLQALPEKYTQALAKENGDLIMGIGEPVDVERLSAFVADCELRKDGAVRITQFVDKDVARIIDLQMQSGRLYCTVDEHRDPASLTGEAGEEYDSVELSNEEGAYELLLRSELYDEPLVVLSFTA